MYQVASLHVASLSHGVTQRPIVGARLVAVWASHNGPPAALTKTVTVTHAKIAGISRKDGIGQRDFDVVFGDRCGTDGDLSVDR